MKRRTRRIKRTFTDFDHALWRKVMDDFLHTRAYRPIDLTIAEERAKAALDRYHVKVYTERTYHISELPQEDKERLGL